MAKKILPLVAAAAIIVSLGCEVEEVEPWSQADWTNAGWESWAKGDYETAEQAFGSALKVDPYYAEAHAGMGWTLLRTQDIDDAIDAFEDAVLYGEQVGTPLQIRQVIYMGAATTYEAGDEYELSVARGRYLVNKLDGDNFKFLPKGDPGGHITGYDLYVILALDYYGLGDASNCVWAINRMRRKIQEPVNYKFKNWKETTAEIERLIAKDPS
ncbi:MAG: tetratricopeptide repeat protein [candidate division Zixibacteria bacterium]|nr:tetratricopeptide repeat protein [candidate division Zixibacteria bacterium]